MKTDCEYCKGTGVVTLLTSVVPCECAEDKPVDKPKREMYVPWFSGFESYAEYVEYYSTK
jgi:hypothetical protein